MLHAIFDMGISVGEKALRAALVYGFLLIALRVLGKRELAQQNTLDLLVILLVANAVQNGIIGNDNSVTGAVVGAAVLFGLHRLFGALAYRYPWADRLLEGTPSLPHEGRAAGEGTLRHEQISRPQLVAMARRQGFDHLDDVETTRSSRPTAACKFSAARRDVHRSARAPAHPRPRARSAAPARCIESPAMARVVAITGAARGIGLATAQALAAAWGARRDRRPRRRRGRGRRGGLPGGEHAGFALDVTDEARSRASSTPPPSAWARSTCS